MKESIKKYIFTVLLVIGLVVGNIICYNVNGRFLTITTNLVFVFLIVVSLIKDANSISKIK